MRRLTRVGFALGLALTVMQQAHAQGGSRTPASPGIAPSVAPEPRGGMAPEAPASARRGTDRPGPERPAVAPARPEFPAVPPVGETWRQPLPLAVPLPTIPIHPVPAPSPLLPAPLLPGAPASDADHEPGQLLVLWPDLAEAQRGMLLLQQQYQVAPRQRQVLENLGGVLALLVLPSETEARALRDRLRAEHPGWVVDLNARAGPQQSAPPRVYARQMLGLSLVRRGATLPTLRVGVVDTQVSPGLLQPSSLNGSVAYQRSVLEPGERPADPAHGDALLQLIAGAERDAQFAGAAPPVQLFWAGAMRDLDGKSSTNSMLLAQALDWLLGQRVVLVNLSLGGGGDAILQAVISRVLAANVAIVAAAGNNPTPGAPPTYPAAYAGVWAVTAVDAAGRLSAGASRARYVMLAAPGVEVWVPAGDGGLYVSGTSYAAALATATLAWQPADFWRLAAVRRAAEVCARARKLEDSAFPGCGLVQKAAAP